MEQIGLSESETKQCFRLATSANAYWKAKDMVLSSTGIQKSVDNACRQVQGFFTRFRGANNFFLLMAAERIMCIADLKHFQNSQRDNPDAFHNAIILRTLHEGVEQMDEISDKLTTRSRDVKTFHVYSSCTQTVKGDHDRKGLPKDAIRKLLPSHRTRLENKNKGMDGVSNDEVNLIGLRRENIQSAEQLYMTMQREALGIGDKPEKQGK
jgi:hypothetical protein